MRTAAEGEAEEKLASEMAFLNNLWANIQKKSEKATAASILHHEISVSLRAVRDLLIHEVEKLVIDDKATYESVLSFLDTFSGRTPFPGHFFRTPGLQWLALGVDFRPKPGP